MAVADSSEIKAMLLAFEEREQRAESDAVAAAWAEATAMLRTLMSTEPGTGERETVDG